MQTIRQVMLVLMVAAACSGEKKHEGHAELAIAGAPRCPQGAALAHPIAIYAQRGSMKFFGAYTGALGNSVTVPNSKGEVTIQFGICPNPPSGSTYVCASNNHDGVTYYATRKVSYDPAVPGTMQAELARPPDPAGLRCTDGSTAN